MRTLLAFALSVLATGAVAAEGGGAQTAQAPVPLERTVTVAVGQEIQLSVVSNSNEACTGHPVPEIRIVTPPARGTLTVRFVGLRIPPTAPRCVDKVLPALALYYRPADGAQAGSDAVQIETAVSTARSLRNFTIAVTR